MKDDMLDYFRCMGMFVIFVVFGAILRVQYDVLRLWKRINKKKQIKMSNR